MANRTKRTPKKEEKFLEVLRKTANVSKACKAIQIGRTQAYSWRESDEVFAVAWDDAIQEGLDALEEEARRRAATGILKPVFYKGKKCGAIREYSDTLLIFLLKGGRPEKFRERFEHSGDTNQPIKVVVEHVRQSTTQDD